MANVSFTVRYTQSDNASGPGEITFNGVTQTASGRLDDVGNFVFAQGFSAEGYDVVIECVRTSKHRMQIRIIFTDVLPFALSFLRFDNLQPSELYTNVGIGGFLRKKVDTLIADSRDS
jgi:hypothetical protein